MWSRRPRLRKHSRGRLFHIFDVKTLPCPKMDFCRVFYAVIYKQLHREYSRKTASPRTKKSGIIGKKIEERGLG